MSFSTSPCTLDCPAGTDVRRFLLLASRGDAAGAFRTILERNPLPAVCGRICDHPCEAGCNRGSVDEGIAVRAIERAVAAEAARLNVTAAVPVRTAEPTGRRVAIVGSGPAGLSCAYHLALAGHRPVIFEAAEQPGGILRYRIPAYRLPREVLDEEIDRIKRLGVEIRTSQRVGADVSWDDLAAFDALFVATGNPAPIALGIPGEALQGVRPAIDFLGDVNAGRPLHVSRRVVVIGGDSTAVDAARVALRNGSKVTVISAHSCEETPAPADEVRQAEIEGVRFIYRASPLRLQGWRGVLTSVHCQRTRPGAPDGAGRSEPEPIPGATFTRSCDEVLTSAGDAVPDAATIAHAIGAGRRGAEVVHAKLCGGALYRERDAGARAVSADQDTSNVSAAARVHVPLLHKSYAIASFREVAGPVAWSDAVAEAGRCLHCGSDDAR